MGFDRERATYERHKPDLLKTAEGQWVVIVGDELIGPLESGEEAELAGYKRNDSNGPALARTEEINGRVTEINRETLERERATANRDGATGFA